MDEQVVGIADRMSAVYNAGQRPALIMAIFRTLRKMLPIAAWIIVGLVFTSQLHFFAAHAGGKMSWLDSLVWEIPRWLLWAFFAPFVTRLARRYPVHKENAAKRIALHTFFGVIFSLIHLVLFVLIFHGIRTLMGDHGKFFDTLQFAFALDFHVGVAVYWLLVLLRQSRDSEQRIARLHAELSQAQLQALKMQLHPHFLFNTLNSISSYLRKDVEIADEMIGRLGDFLRLTLQNSGAQEIPLQQELNFLKQYLEIEQLRFQDRLNADFDIAPETLTALVPNLILQPIVENAVRHGVSAKSGPGTIQIIAKRNDSKLQIIISDNGPGIPEQPRQGIGITSTLNRLEQLYGAQGVFQITNRSDGGTIAILEIPFRESEAK
ncbi:histidine kinase [bacterium]|nr:histidine kinase [bacterium]